MTEELKPEPDRPMIDMPFARVWCPRHGEPLRDKWPSGHLIASLKMLETWLAYPESAWETKGEAEGIGACLDRKPLCCRLNAEDLVRIYESLKEVGVAVDGSCCNCHRRRLGAPYMLRIGERVKRMSHACFDCVVNRMEERKER